MFSQKIFLLISLGFLVQSAPFDNHNETFKFVVIHNNDMHSRFEQTGAMGENCKKIDQEGNKCYGGFARIAHLVKDFRRRAEIGEIPKVIFLNAGDTFTGTSWFTAYKDVISSEFSNLLNPDAMTLGNHEFDLGPEVLGRFLRKVHFPVLSTNMNIENEPDLEADSLKSSVVFEIDGRKIGIVGYLTPDTKHISAPTNVEFVDEITAVNNESSLLKSQGVNIIIALGHSGLSKDKEVAEKCPDVDLVIGSHSHSFLYSGTPPDIDQPRDEYPVYVMQSSGKKVPVVQAYAFTKYLGYIEVEFDQNGNLLKFEGSPILLNGSIPQDQDVLDLIERYRPGISDSHKEIIGATEVFLDGNCRLAECNLGNFVADALVNYLKVQKLHHAIDDSVTIAFVNGGDIRSSFDHISSDGKVTMDDALTSMPFKNNLTMVTLKGKVLLEALEHSVRRYDHKDTWGEFLQVSGIKVAYNMTKPPSERVMSVKVIGEQNEIFDLDELKNYNVLMTDFLAYGGDGYKMFKNHIVKIFNTFVSEIFIEYIKEKSPLAPKIEGRISIV